MVWNDCLRDRRQAHAAGLPYATSAERSKVRITQAKRTEERAWLADVSAVVLQRSLRDLDAAFKSFFDNQAVYVEDLAVHALGRTRLAKSVHDVGWAAFVHMMEYKATKHGRHFGKIGRFEPTSQVCSTCGHRDGPKPLDVRRWQCGVCGAGHDRDENAAINTLAAGRADRLNALWSADQTRARVLAPRDEAGSHRPKRPGAPRP